MGTAGQTKLCEISDLRTIITQIARLTAGNVSTGVQ
jgi:hypothetical protein